MQIDSINLNNLRVFQSVYKTRCMTTASRELHLTQSGVSQHIKSLEDTLAVKLFDRINKKIYPTAAGDRLFEVVQPALGTIEEALGSVTTREREIKGVVNIGMPIEFGNNRIVPILARLGLEFPRLQFHLTLDFASHMNEELLKGQLDFAFVDEFQLDKRIEVEEVADEVLELVATEKFLKRFGKPTLNKNFFEQLEYVEYQTGEPVLRSWFSHHLKRKNLELNVRAHVMDVQAIARLVLADLGAGVLPDHLVSKLQAEGHKIQVFKGCGKPLKNHLSLAYLKNRTRPPHVAKILEELKKSLAAR